MLRPLRMCSAKRQDNRQRHNNRPSQIRRPRNPPPWLLLTALARSISRAERPSAWTPSTRRGNFRSCAELFIDRLKLVDEESRRVARRERGISFGRL